LADADLLRVSLQEVFVARQTDARKSFANSLPFGTAPAMLGSMASPCLRQLGPDLQRRIQRGHRALQHQGDLAPANRPQIALSQCEQIAAIELNPSPSGPTLPLQKPQDRKRQSALAGSACSDQPD